MKYDNITQAVFLRRVNRFIAEVELEGRRETVHVKNTTAISYFSNRSSSVTWL